MVARLGEVGRPTRPQWVGVIRMEMRPAWTAAVGQPGLIKGLMDH